MRALILLAACSGQIGNDFKPTSAGVVDGQLEPGYPAVGYLTLSDHKNELCTVTLIRPNVALTAAHCVDSSNYSNSVHSWARYNLYRVGWGAFADGDSHTIKKIFPIDAYYREGTAQHDLAVIYLSEPLPYAPAELVSASPDSPARYVGYGRNTPGDANVKGGYNGPKKSTAEHIVSISGSVIEAEGVGGGLCWGDSGGPLFVDGTQQLMGVLHGFAHQPYDCQSGDTMRFNAAIEQQHFIDLAIGCGDSEDLHCLDDALAPQPDPTPQPDLAPQPDPADGGAPTADGGAPTAAPCEFSCADYGYDPGQCYQGWLCDGSCVSFTGC
jgi:Trypsin